MHINTAVVVACTFSSLLMEIIMLKAPTSANFITFLQFFFVSLQGFITTTKFGTVRSKIPLQQYGALVILYFATSVANNYVYALHVSSALHRIIRSAASPASMIVYWYAKGKVPRFTNALGSILITAGIGLAIYGGASKAENEGTYTQWSLGVSILLITLFTGAFTGLQQELLYSKYGKHPDEMVFYTNALPLPIFLAIYSQLKEIAINLTKEIYTMIFLNIMAQFYCLHAVHRLASKETSVDVTFILTVRKFLALLLSAVFFKNNLTYLHIIGSILVVAGTIIYFNLFSYRKQVPVKRKIF